MRLVSQDNAPQNGNFDRELFDKTTVCGLSLKIMQIGAPEVESDYLERFMQFYANEQESKNKVARSHKYRWYVSRLAAPGGQLAKDAHSIMLKQTFFYHKHGHRCSFFSP